MKKSDKILSILWFRLFPVFLVMTYIKMLFDIKDTFSSGVLAVVGFILPILGLTMWLLGDIVFKKN